MHTTYKYHNLCWIWSSTTAAQSVIRMKVSVKQDRCSVHSTGLILGLCPESDSILRYVLLTITSRLRLKGQTLKCQLQMASLFGQFSLISVLAVLVSLSYRLGLCAALLVIGLRLQHLSRPRVDTWVSVANSFQMVTGVSTSGWMDSRYLDQ